MPAAILTEFSPSANQLAFVTFQEANGYAGSYVKAGVSIGVTHSAISQWFNKPAFAEWYQAQAEEWYRKRLPDIYKAVRVSAVGAVDKRLRGSAKAQELYLQRFDRGFIPKSQQSVDARITQEAPAYELAASKLLDALAKKALEIGAKQAQKTLVTEAVVVSDQDQDEKPASLPDKQGLDSANV